ncbi:hypothetical protein KQ51_01811 [Candidatus Izimaplasma bacterium HR1]|jgi:hypothetical protein|uniref:hypothetical protein n=1 Tax=Candidatus Izimoplasma sp. HR1 TaxID=1541959 RepID=UPI0004F6073C|nr:hypothetical protein KQ51_01811 [Candidatus Izimaplasma bacterium HR1]
MSYINDFIKVIRTIENDNTYKTAWGRAIIECINNQEYEIQGEAYVIYHYELVQKVMKYYWNQIGFFKLSQGPSSVLEARIEEIKNDFEDNTKIKYPVWFDKVEIFLKRNPIRFERQVKKFITIVNKGVAAKFEKIDTKTKVELYDLDTKSKCLRFTEEQVNLIKENTLVLEDIIDYKWAELLEGYNKSPNIIRKVKGSKEYRFKRQNLIKYRNVLLEYCHLEGSKDFYSDEPIELENIKLEYVIPYDFVYTNDIWNTIIVSKETAKKRRGKVPTKNDVDRLNERNKALYNAIKETHLKVRFEVERALEEHLVTRYYIDLNG